MLDRRNVKSLLLVASQNFQLQYLIYAMQIQRRRQRRQSFNAPIVGEKNDVLDLQPRRRCRTVWLHVNHYHAPASRQVQTIRQRGRNLLRHRANLHAMHMPVLAQAVINKIHHPRRNRKAQPLAAAALRQNKSIDPDHRAVHIHERTAAVSRIDRRIGLDISNRLGRIGLPRQRADHTHGHRILQTFRTSNRKHQLPHPRTLLADQRQRRQIRVVDLQQRQIGFLVQAEEPRLENAPLALRHLAGIAHGQRQRHANPLRAFHHVRVGHDVAIRIDNHSRAHRMLAHNQRRLRAILLAQRTISRNQNLHHRRRNPRRQALERIVELHQRLERLIRARLRLSLRRPGERSCTGSRTGSRVARLLRQHPRT